METIIETHLSHVVLRDVDVVKTLKPVCYPFVDFSTMECRRAACEAEVVHNRPWAPDVYLGVITTEAGEPAVHMRRLAAADTLTAHRDTLDGSRMRALGRFLRERHEAMPEVPGSASAPRVRARMLDNLAELQDVAGKRLVDLVGRSGRALKSRLMEDGEALLARADTGRRLHGDLRAEHVYVAPDGFRVLDGVAFDRALASGDPIEDVAFLAMDVACSLGRWDLVEPLWDGWGGAPAALRSLYAGHRSLIRAKVALLSNDAVAARRHLLHALVHWEPAERRPCLVAFGGLPGVGKSTVARDLAGSDGFVHLRTDVVRKEHPGSPDYSDAGRTQVYDRLGAVVARHLARGERVIVDASFGREVWRQPLIRTAVEHGVPLLLVFCEVEPAEALRRIAGREGDPSDADASVYERARAAWEAPSIETARWSVGLSTVDRHAGKRLRALLAARGWVAPLPARARSDDAA